MSDYLNNGLHTLDTLHQIFEVVKRCVWDSGGDGWGWIVTKNPDLLCDEFEKWEAEHGAYWLRNEEHRWDFSHDQEGISFTDSAPGKSEGDDEITVIIPWAAGVY